MGIESIQPTAGLRIVGFHVVPQAYQVFADWAARHGHRIILVVTSPGPAGAATPDTSSKRYGTGVADLVATVPRAQDVLVTTRMKTIAMPVLRTLAPDLIVCASFPHRIPPEVVAIPRLGAVNLHPAPLPRGRGPNAFRLVYEGDTTVGATLHRIVPEFDAGPIINRQVRPLPKDLTTERLWAAFGEAVFAAVEEGMSRAIAGDLGTPQDEAEATYAAPFTQAETWLDWSEPGRTLQRKTVALNFPVLTRARAEIAGEVWGVRRVRPLAGDAGCGEPGSLVDRTASLLTVCAGDGPVEVEVVDLTTGTAAG